MVGRRAEASWSSSSTCVEQGSAASGIADIDPEARADGDVGRQGDVAYEKAEDGALYWTLSLYFDAAAVAAALGEPLTPQFCRERRLAHRASWVLGAAIDPLFNDIADRDRLGSTEDFLFAAGIGDCSELDRSQLDDWVRRPLEARFHLPPSISWETEGKTFVCTFPPEEVDSAGRSTRLRRFWFTHTNGALSYHLSFRYHFGSGQKSASDSGGSTEQAKRDAVTYYFLSLLQKLAVPKEFKLSDRRLAELIESRRPFTVFDDQLGIDPLDSLSLEVLESFRSGTAAPASLAPTFPTAERRRFWPMVRALFEHDALILFRDVWKHKRWTLAEAGDIRLPILMRSTLRELIEVPGLKVPRSRSLFFFQDRRFFGRLLPGSNHGERRSRREMVNELCFAPYAYRLRRSRELSGRYQIGGSPGGRPESPSEAPEAELPREPSVSGEWTPLPPASSGSGGDEQRGPGASRSGDGFAARAEPPELDPEASVTWDWLDRREDYEQLLELQDPVSKRWAFSRDAEGLERVESGEELVALSREGRCFQNIRPKEEGSGVEFLKEGILRHIPLFEPGRPDCLDYLFLAGFNQNIIDWLNQEPSEILDSTDPIYPKEESQLDEAFFVRFANHRAITTYVPKSRSLEVGNDYLGTCPYAFLIHILALHNEFLARDHEQVTARKLPQIQTLLRREESPRALGATARAPHQRPGILGEKGLTLWFLSWWNPQQGAPTETHEERFEAIESQINQLKYSHYEDFERHRFANIFRYDTERDVFEAIENLRGMGRRDVALREALASLEESSRDVELRRRKEAEEAVEARTGRLNRFALFIGIASGSSVLFNIADFFEKSHWNEHAFALRSLTTGLVGLAVVLALFAIARKLR